MKHEWRKAEKEIYIPKKTPEKLFVPKFKYFTIKGEGNPNSEDFTQRIEVLYRLSYGIKMMPKRGFYPGGYYEYTVYPSEAVWELDEDGVLDKDKLKYTLMIRQPDFVTGAVARMITTTIISTNPHPLINEVKFTSIEEGDCVQILHTGPYENEQESFEIMDRFLEENNLSREDKTHKEIYLNDPKKTELQKLKTVLRYKIKS